MIVSLMFKVRPNFTCMQIQAKANALFGISLVLYSLSNHNT